MGLVKGYYLNYYHSENSPRFFKTLMNHPHIILVIFVSLLTGTQTLYI